MSLLKTKRNSVKAGQYWQKKDTGVVVYIQAKHKEPFMRTVKADRKNSKSSHIISKYDLLKYYTLL